MWTIFKLNFKCKSTFVDPVIDIKKAYYTICVCCSAVIISISLISKCQSNPHRFQVSIYAKKKGYRSRCLLYIITNIYAIFFCVVSGFFNHFFSILMWCCKCRLEYKCFLLIIHFFQLSWGKLYTNTLYCVPTIIVFPLLLLIVYYCCSLVLYFVLLIPITIF